MPRKEYYKVVHQYFDGLGLRLYRAPSQQDARCLFGVVPPHPEKVLHTHGSLPARYAGQRTAFP